MGSVDRENGRAEDAAPARRDDYAAPELKLVGKVSELAQFNNNIGADGAGYS